MDWLMAAPLEPAVDTMGSASSLSEADSKPSSMTELAKVTYFSKLASLAFFLNDGLPMSVFDRTFTDGFDIGSFTDGFADGSFIDGSLFGCCLVYIVCLLRYF